MSKRLSALCRQAVVAGFSVFTVTAASAAPSMDIGGPTSQPIGHYEFCKLNPDECLVKSAPVDPFRLTKQNWRMIFAVNRAANARIQPRTDLEIYGKDEVWSYPIRFGDCEDYVLLKRRALVDKGIPLSNLLITVVRKPDGEGHAVLTVRTDRGDFILDNLNEDVLSWESTDYRYLKRQSSQHSGRWVTIESRQDVLVGSVD